MVYIPHCLYCSSHTLGTNLMEEAPSSPMFSPILQPMHKFSANATLHCDLVHVLFKKRSKGEGGGGDTTMLIRDFFFWGGGDGWKWNVVYTFRNSVTV